MDETRDSETATNEGTAAPKVSRFMSLWATAKAAISSPTNDSLRLLQGVVTEVGKLPTPKDTVPYAELLLDIGTFLLGHSREPRVALMPLELAVSLSQRGANRDLLRKSLMIAGNVCSDTGDIGKGLEFYREALEVAESLDDPFPMGVVWNNIGLALTYAAQFRDAVLCFRRSIQFVRKSTSTNAPFVVHTALANIALCCLHLEEFDEGLIAASEADEALPDPKPHEIHNRVLLEYTFTRLLLAKGSVAEARKHSMLARGFASRTQMPRAHVAADNAEGLVEAFTGLFDVGVTRLTNSLEKAKTLKAAYRDTLVALVMAHEKANLPEKATEYQQELMRHTQAALHDNILFHNKLHLERLSENPDPTGPIHLVQNLRMEKLKRKISEKALLHERMEMLERLAITAELRDDSTGEHSFRVGRLAAMLAKEVGCDEDECNRIDLAGRLHDIGKIGIPDGILLKPGKLTEHERLIIETHAIVGAELLSKSEMPEMQTAETIARHHHQRWDGTGYPRSEALAGEAIPLVARITALADVYDALTHVRPYKQAWEPELALGEITKLRGTHFDPRLTDAFVGMMRRLLAEHSDLDPLLGKGSAESKYQQSRSKIAEALQRPSKLFIDPDSPQVM